MNEIIVVGDVHEGINFGFQIDPDTGLSKRVYDIHFREMVRRDVIEPLARADIKVWILAGNHDQPHGNRGTSIDDFRGYPHVSVYRQPAVERFEINGKVVGCIIIPYMHPADVAGLVGESDREIPQEQLFSQGQEFLKQWIHTKSDELNADFKLLLAHYYVEGAKLGERLAYPEVLPGEFSFRRDMVPAVDLAVFGHIHLHQVMHTQGAEIVYTGAVERIDWGEKDDRKGFIALSPFEQEKWRFVELPTRDMLKITVEVNANDDPTQKILDVRGKVAEYKIAERLRGAFHYDVHWTERAGERIGFTSYTMDPFELLKKFIDSNYQSHPKREKLLEEGRSALKEVLHAE